MGGIPGDIPVAVESGEATSASLAVEATTRQGGAIESGEATSALLAVEAATQRGGADLFWLMIFRRSARERADVLVTLALEPHCLEREDRFGGICSAGFSWARLWESTCRRGGIGNDFLAGEVLIRG
jgi:hypothetical protein